MLNFLTLAADGVTQADWFTLSFSDVLMIVAVFLAPWLAIFVQRKIDAAAEKRARRNHLFRSLMATRATRASPEHVSALNMIDMEFSPSNAASDQKVVEAWHEYHNSLNYDDIESPEQAAKKQRADECFVELLYAMSQCLGYKFDRGIIRNGWYVPVAHARLEDEWTALRQDLREVLSGNRSVSISVPQDQATLDRQFALQAALVQVLIGKAPLSFKFHSDPSTTPKAPPPPTPPPRRPPGT